MKHTLRIALTTAAILALSACVETPIQQVRPALDYSALAVTTFDVNEKIVINDASLSAEAKKMAETYNLSIESALKEWLKHRVKKGGSQGTFYVIIKENSVGTRKLATTGGIQGYFKREQAEELTGTVEVLFSIEGSAQQLPPAEASVKVHAKETLPEEASATEREKAYRSLINRLIANVNDESQKQFDNYFRGYQL